jgi:hypothetical protein
MREEMAQETTVDATDATIGLSIRIRVWPSGQRAAVRATAKKRSLLQVSKKKRIACLPLTPDRAEPLSKYKDALHGEERSEETEKRNLCPLAIKRGLHHSSISAIACDASGEVPNDLSA